MSRLILITGGTGIIGRALVERFIALGDRVLVTTRLAATLQGNDIPAQPGRMEVLEIDLQAEGSSEKLLAEIKRRALQPHALVNAARDLANLHYLADSPADRRKWQHEYLLDVIVPFELAVGLASQAASRLETVVNIGSMYGTVAAPTRLYDDPDRQSPVNYGPAKAALVQLTRDLAVRLAPQGIRVNAVSYGGVAGRASPELQTRYGQFCPTGRMLRHDEIAGPVEFLVSRASSGITGQNLLVDGGWTAW